MLTILGSDILLITGDIVFGRNQAEKSLERGVVSFERFQQFYGRDHSAVTAELKRERCGYKRRVIDQLLTIRAPDTRVPFHLGTRWGSSLLGNKTS